MRDARQQILKLIQCSDVEKSVNCSNCALLEKQLNSALMELKPAEAIISLLREDMKNTNTPRTADHQIPTITFETCNNEASEYEQNSESGHQSRTKTTKWINRISQIW